MRHRARRADGLLDDYVTARNSQGAQAIGLSFLASSMGAWILFAPPEIGAFVGPVALATKLAEQEKEGAAFMISEVAT